MAGRATNAEAFARRQRVAELWVRGVSLAGIGKAVGCDWETVKRDVVYLGAEAAKEVDVGRELHRLLLAGRAVESDAWLRREPMQALAAQRQQLAVLQIMQGLDVERRLGEVEAKLDDAQGVNAWAAPHVRALQRAGRN